MKIFFKNILFFLVPILIISFAFEVYLRTMKTDYKQKLEGLKNNYNAIELLVLGKLS